MSERKAFRVKSGNLSIRIYQHPKGWRFGYRGEGGAWQYVTRKKRSDIVAAAEDTLEGMAEGFTWARLAGEARRILADLWTS